MTSTRRLPWATGLLLVLASACGNQAPPGTVAPTIEERRVPRGEPFELDANERVGVEGSDLRIAFLDVKNDSRCPSDAQCPHAGDAVVQLAISALEGERTLELHVVGEPKVRGVFGHRVELISLEPAPSSGEAIEHDDYEVTLRIVE